MPLLHHPTRTVNTREQPRPAFVTPGGVSRRSAQGDVRRCTPLELALLSISQDRVWRLEAHRED